MALLRPGPRGWIAPALPFDNAERVDHEPPRGLFPVAGVWRVVIGCPESPRGLAGASLHGEPEIILDRRNCIIPLIRAPGGTEGAGKPS